MILCVDVYYTVAFIRFSTRFCCVSLVRTYKIFHLSKTNTKIEIPIFPLSQFKSCLVQIESRSFRSLLCGFTSNVCFLIPNKNYFFFLQIIRLFLTAAIISLFPSYQEFWYYSFLHFNKISIECLL